MTDMKRTRFTEEQIIGFLKQAEAGMPIKELCRQGGFSDATFYKWRAKFGGMQASEAKRLREIDEVISARDVICPAGAGKSADGMRGCFIVLV
jgi:putative transposase